MNAGLPGQVTLRDGTPALIWPLLASDVAGLREAYGRLSADARWSRFLTPRKTLDDALIGRLVTDVDGVHHVALVLVALPDDGEAEPVGVGRLVQLDDPGAADIALTVADGWRGRGVGTALALELLARRPDGVRRLDTVVAEGNRPILALLGKLGEVRSRRLGDGVLAVGVELPTSTAPAHDPAAAS